MNEDLCAICRGPMTWTRPEPRDEIQIDCPHCGQYVLSGWNEQTIPEVIDRDPSLREILPVWIRSKNATGLVPPLDPRAIDAALNCA